MSLFDAVDSGDLAGVLLFLNQGTSVNDPDADGYCPLVDAVTLGHHGIAELLIMRGADVATDAAGDSRSALSVAVGQEQVECARLLLQHKVRPFCRRCSRA